MRLPWRPLPVFCPFSTRCPFIRKTVLHPSSTTSSSSILISSSTLKSQIKTAMEAEQPYEAEMKVDLRDVSVDKNPSFLLVLLVVLFLEQHKLRSTLSFSVTSLSIV